MRDDRNDSSVAAHGIGTVLAGVLSLFARSADDVARIGVHYVDDVGRACVTTSDDIGSLMSRNADDLFRQVDDFPVQGYVDDKALDVSFPRAAVVVRATAMDSIDSLTSS